MDPKEIVDEVVRAASDAAEVVVHEVKRIAASEQGRAVRHYVATGLIMAAPAVASMPALRRTKLGKLVEMAGGAALVVTLAEKIRDWDPESAQG